jgi:hypothetical protein
VLLQVTALKQVTTSKVDLKEERNKLTLFNIKEAISTIEIAFFMGSF